MVVKCRAHGQEPPADHPDHYAWLGNDAADRAARAALKLAPDHPEALKQLGLALANGTGDLDGALAAFRRLRRLLPPDRATEIDGVLTHLVALGARAPAESP